MKRGCPDHPKMEAFADGLGVRLREAVGMIELLLHLADTYAPRGDIGKFSDKQIAKRLDWDGEPEELTRALSEAGWLDPHSVHRYVLHDWPEHAPAYTVKKVRGKTGGAVLGWAVDDVPGPQVLEPEEEPDDSGTFQNDLEDSGLPRQGKAYQGKANQTKAGHGEPENSRPPASVSRSVPESPKPKPQGPAPEHRARDVWPRLRAVAAEFGVNWAAKPGAAQLKLLATRIRDDELDEGQLEAVVRGYVALRGTAVSGDFNPLQHLVAKTLYAASNWPDYLAAAEHPPPRKQPHQATKPMSYYEGPKRPEGEGKLLADLSDEERAALVAENRKVFEGRAAS